MKNGDPRWLEMETLGGQGKEGGTEEREMQELLGQGGGRVRGAGAASVVLGTGDPSSPISSNRR